jgi:hypothetical protein
MAETMRLGDIIEDPEYQVRQRVDPVTVSHYAECMKNGDTFPPVNVEQLTKKLVCGFTRLPAYRRVKDPDDHIPVRFMHFKNKKELLLFAAQDNATHGKPYNNWDLANLAERLRSLGAKVDEIAGALKMSKSRAGELAGFDIVVVGNRPVFKEERFEGKRSPGTYKAIVDGEPKAIKDSLKYLHGTKLHPEAHEYQARHVMTSVAPLCNQLIGFLEHDELIDRAKDVVLLEKLYQKLRAWLNKEKKAA